MPAPGPLSLIRSGSDCSIVPHCRYLFADAAGVLEVAAEVDEVSELLLAFGTNLVLDVEVFDVVSDAEVVVDAVEREYPSAA